MRLLNLLRNLLYIFESLLFVAGERSRCLIEIREETVCVLCLVVLSQEAIYFKVNMQ